MREIIQLKTKSIKLNGLNPRKTFSEDALEELASSIRELGLLQPPVVYPDNGRYVLVCGERRLLACRKAKIKTVPCVVIDPPATPAVALQLSLVENLQREDLRVGEEAPAIRELVEGGMKRSEVARALGKSYGYINARYQVALYPEVLAAFVEGGETHVNQWALVGQIEGPEIRGRMIKEFESRDIGNCAGELNACRMIEKRAGGEIEGRMLTRFCKKYENRKAGICKCTGEGWGSDRKDCKHFVDVSYMVGRWLGIDGNYDTAVCTAPDRTCLDYKHEREGVARAKLDRVDKKRLLRQEYRWGEDSYVEASMASADYGPRACKGCKSLCRIPDGWRYSTEFSFNHPYRYCLSEDPACFNAKKADWKAEAADRRGPVDGRSSLTYGQAKEKTDEELQELVLEDTPQDACEECLMQGACGEVLAERGYRFKLERQVEFTKEEGEEE